MKDADGNILELKESSSPIQSSSLPQSIRESIISSLHSKESSPAPKNVDIMHLFTQSVKDSSYSDIFE